MIVKKYIKGGLNSDVNPSLVPDGDYLNALNIRNQLGDDGKAGVIRPVPGQTKVATIADDSEGPLEVSTQDVKHMCVDDVNGYIYAFVSGTVVKPGTDILPYIVRIDTKTNDEQIVFRSRDIDWDPGSDNSYNWEDLVEAKVVGSTLVWINKNGNQFSLNVDAYLNTSTDTPYFIDNTVGRRDISLIKSPPAFPILAVKLTDASYTGINYIKDNVFQFAYRYTYVGYEQSVVSPWSQEIPMNASADTYNYIRLSIPLVEKIPVSILELDIICKNNATGAINIVKKFSSLGQGGFVEFNKHNINDNQLSFDFYNDNIYESVDSAYFIKQFDSVPVSSLSLEVSKDRLFLANSVEGYDAPKYSSLTTSVSEPTAGVQFFKYYTDEYPITLTDIDNEVVNNEYYWRNVVFINTKWYYVPGEIATGISSKVGQFNVTAGDVAGECRIVSTNTAVVDFQTLNLYNGCQIHVTGFVNSSNNGYYVVEEVESQSTMLVVKADANLPVLETGSTMVTINLLSAIHGQTAGVLGNIPTPDPVSTFSSLIEIGTSLTTTNINDYIANRDVAKYHVYEYISYTKASSILSTVEISVSGVPNSQSRTFKSGSKYNIGIQFYDFALRKSGVTSKFGELILSLDGDPDYISTRDITVSIPDRSYSAVPLQVINWQLPSGTQLEIPEWAKYYSVVRTDNLETRYFIQGEVSASTTIPELNYVTKDATTNQYSVGTSKLTHDSNVAGIAIDLQSIINDGFGYIYEEENGDVVKIYKSTNAATDKHTLRVIGQQGRYIILEPKNISTIVTTPTADIWRYEIRRPYKASGSEPFYETSIYSINNWGTSTRSYSTTSGYISGDTFVSNNLEYMNLREEFRNFWYRNLGRACFIDPIGQVYRPNGVRWSNVFIPGAKVNGLSTFDAIDYKDLPVELGPINKLKTTSKAQSEGNVMLAIGQNYTASMYIGETSLVDNAGQTLLTTSGSVVGTVNVLKGRFGTTLPGSVVEYDGNVYWADIVNECVVRYSSNGLFAISDTGMRNFFRSYFKVKKGETDEYDITQSPYIYGGYNPATDEYILSFSQTLQAQQSYPDSSSFRLSDVKMMYRAGTPAKSVGFSVSQERWTSFYSHSGPYVYFGGKMYSFIKSTYQILGEGVRFSGGVFVYDKDSVINNFSGATRDSFVSIPYNDAPNNNKIFQAISIEGTTAPTTTYVETFIPNNQVTNMVASDFVNREDMLYAEIFRDRVSPNACGTADQKMFTGDKMRGQYANMSLIWSSPSNFETRFVNVKIKDSIGHNKLSQ
jgi:hypothetical protein